MNKIDQEKDFYSRTVPASHKSTESLNPQITPQDNILAKEDAKYYHTKDIKSEKLVFKFRQ